MKKQKKSKWVWLEIVVPYRAIFLKSPKTLKNFKQ